jgi:hydroxymethylpyrimidine/phosphomethylpyrimidine kinase
MAIPISMRPEYGSIAPLGRIFLRKIPIFLIFSSSQVQTVLTIAGFDPSSGAGVTADLMVFAAHSLFGTACITALTVQSTLGVRASHPVDAAVIETTLGHLTVDLPPAGIKIGMVSNANNIHAISHFIRQLRNLDSENPVARIPIVFDPVLKSSSGQELLDQTGIAALRDDLLPLVDWVTPNLAELAILAGQTVAVREDIPNACKGLQAIASRTQKGSTLGVIATGGHMNPPDDFVQMPHGGTVWLPGNRIDTRATHGTGCAFSSAFLSRLVLGDGPVAAAEAAKRYVAEAMRRAEVIGGGASPMNLLWPLYECNS